MLKEQITFTQSLTKLVERLTDEEISFPKSNDGRSLCFDIGNNVLIVYAEDVKKPFECVLRVYRREDWWNDYSVYHGAEIDSVVDTIREFV
jgi:hypothetical protein